MSTCDILIFSDVPDIWSTPLKSTLQLESWGASNGVSCVSVGIFRQLSPAQVVASVQRFDPRVVLIDVHWELAVGNLAADPAIHARIAALRASSPKRPLVVCVPWGQPFANEELAWPSLVDQISLSGVDIADPLLGFLVPGEWPTEGRYYAAATPTVTRYEPLDRADVACLVVELEPWVCSMHCAACVQAPGCTRTQLPWRAVGAPMHSVAALSASAERLAARGGYISVVDQNMAQPEKLALLRALHEEYPAVGWVITLNSLALPSLGPGSLQAMGVAGVQLFAPEITSQLPSQLRMLRAALGDGFLELIAAFGGVADSAATVSTFTEWVCDPAQLDLLDNYQAIPQLLPLASRLGCSGAYRFPYPGRETAPGQPYWETDALDSDTLQAVCHASTQKFQEHAPLMAELQTLSRAMRLRNHGIALPELRRRSDFDLVKLGDALLGKLVSGVCEDESCLL